MPHNPLKTRGLRPFLIEGRPAGNRAEEREKTGGRTHHSDLTTGPEFVVSPAFCDVQGDLRTLDAVLAALNEGGIHAMGDVGDRGVG